VELIDFDARPTLAGIQLNWSTGSERDSDRFEVEHSTDLEVWSHIGWTRAAGFSVVTQLYDLLDRDPAPGMNFYRLRMVDTDGTEEFSPVREVTWSPRGPAAYPNPSDGTLWVRRAGEHINVDVFDALGRQIPYTTVVMEETLLQIHLGAGSSGLYTIRIGTPHSYYSERVVVTGQ
jgi:hypothetical protein